MCALCRRLRRIEQKVNAVADTLDQILGKVKVMAERIKAVEAKFDEYVAKVTALLTTIEAAKAEAVRADDAGEDDALAVFVDKIDAAIAGLPASDGAFNPSAVPE